MSLVLQLYCAPFGSSENWLTAYQLLHFIANISTGDKVLIHAAGSGVGTAAIQLAKIAGAEVYTVAGTAEKIEKTIQYVR